MITVSNTIWERKYSCTDKYQCAAPLLIFCCLAHSSNIIIDREMPFQGNVKYVVGIINNLLKIV